MTSPRLLTRSGTLLFFTNSSCSNSPLALFFGYAPSFLIVELKSRLVVPTAAPSASDEGSHRARYLVQSSSFCLLMTSLRIYLGMPMPPCMLTIWSSSPDPLKASYVVQSSLAVLETWSNLWRLPLNPKRCESSFFSTDPHQATFQPRLNLLGFPLLFNPTPKFLGVTFDQTLSFGAHVQSLCSKFYSRHKALRSIATASWGPTKESLSLLYKAFVRLVLTYASPGWFPLLCNTATNHLEVLHRAACRFITGCLSSTPSSLLLLQLPPLKLTLEHQTLYSFERGLRLPPDFSSLYALAIRNVPCRLKKKPSWRSFCSSATQPLPSPRESLISCPPFPPWSTTHFTVSPFIPDCTGSSTARLQIASRRLFPSPRLISKYGLTDLSPPFLVLVALECICNMLQMQH